MAATSLSCPCPIELGVVIDVERSEEDVISLCGEGEGCEAMQTGLQLAGLRTNFNQKARLAGCIASCVAVKNRSGLMVGTSSPAILSLLLHTKLLIIPSVASVMVI